MTAMPQRVPALALLGSGTAAVRSESRGPAVGNQCVATGSKQTAYWPRAHWPGESQPLPRLCQSGSGVSTCRIQLILGELIELLLLLNKFNLSLNIVGPTEASTEGHPPSGYPTQSLPKETMTIRNTSWSATHLIVTMIT